MALLGLEWVDRAMIRPSDPGSSEGDGSGYSDMTETDNYVS